MLREGLDFFGVGERWDDVLEFDLSPPTLDKARGDGAGLWNGMGAGDFSGDGEEEDIRFNLVGDFLSLLDLAGDSEESEEAEESDESECLCRFFLSF